MVSTSGRLETVPLKQISMWRSDTAKNENTVRGELKSSTYETDVKKIASASGADPGFIFRRGCTRLLLYFQH